MGQGNIFAWSKAEGVALSEIGARVVQDRASARARGCIPTGTTWEVVAAELGTQFPIRTAEAVKRQYYLRIGELAKHLPRADFDALAKKYSIVPKRGYKESGSYEYHGVTLQTVPYVANDSDRDNLREKLTKRSRPVSYVGGPSAGVEN